MESHCSPSAGGCKGISFCRDQRFVPLHHVAVLVKRIVGAFRIDVCPHIGAEVGHAHRPVVVRRVVTARRSFGSGSSIALRGVIPITGERTATLEECRRGWTSDLFSNKSPEQREAEDKRTVKDRVGEYVKELLKGYDFTPDSAIIKELNRIYDAAVKEFE